MPLCLAGASVEISRNKLPFLLNHYLYVIIQSSFLFLVWREPEEEALAAKRFSFLFFFPCY